MIFINKERLKEIVLFNGKNRNDILSDLDKFYQKNDLKFGELIPDLYLLAKANLTVDGNYLIRMPLKSNVMGAIYRKIGNKIYIVVNSAKKLADNNFALAHELYHYYCPHESLNNTNIDIYFFTYETNQEDLRANAFAGNLLMPEESFIKWQKKLTRIFEEIPDEVYKPLEPDDIYVAKATTRIIFLMLYFRTTFMSVLIRCCELGFLDYSDDRIEKIMMYNDDEMIKKYIDIYSQTTSLDMSALMECTYVDDLKHIKARITDNLKQYVELDIMDPENVQYNLEVLSEMIAKATVTQDGNLSGDSNGH